LTIRYAKPFVAKGLVRPRSRNFLKPGVFLLLEHGGGQKMKKTGLLMIVGLALVLASATAPKANAEVAIRVGVGVGVPVYVHPRPYVYGPRVYVGPQYVVPSPYVGYYAAPIYPRAYVAPAPVYYRHWYPRGYIARRNFYRYHR
jgi:hypothetical protein